MFKNETKKKHLSVTSALFWKAMFNSNNFKQLACDIISLSHCLNSDSAVSHFSLTVFVFTFDGLFGTIVQFQQTWAVEHMASDLTVEYFVI